MDTTAATAAVISLLVLPASCLASLAKQDGWPKQVNQLIAMAIAAAGGACVLWLTGGFRSVGEPGNVAVTFAAFYTAMQAVYVGLKDSWLDTTLAALPARFKSRQRSSARTPDYTPPPLVGPVAWGAFDDLPTTKHPPA